MAQNTISSLDFLGGKNAVELASIDLYLKMAVVGIRFKIIYFAWIIYYKDVFLSVRIAML